VQGVTELTECVRTEYDWLLEVQEEMRAGSLSENNCHFLHEPAYESSWELDPKLVRLREPPANVSRLLLLRLLWFLATP